MEGLAMVDQAELVRVFADYARTLRDGYEVGDVLYRLTDQVVAALDIDGAGVSLGEHGELQFVSASDAQVVRIEDHQTEVGDGPCHEAYASGDVVTSADLTAETRWPRFTPVALQQGWCAVAGVPLYAAGRPLGALDLYRRGPQEWPADRVEAAGVLADMAASYILNAQTIVERDTVREQLQHALDSRVVIEQAKGKLAERHGLDAATAFERLRGAARSRRERIHDAARAVVNGHLDC
ncbi:ANTAR domain-containing protein [Egibacter rhizosphaerae]|uniref:ANTAR domain-containing protein n=2 Tax=Egibacter rhizosphaerae TaxID=1670831 RepID=A0A411YEP5_9ACTN|nr:ANTAR domain-containing protein [Egibacter rhizosphaerae]